ncbi:MAG TPA: hypothetical protein VLI94_03525 [Solirubrobacterales bacterium]|nr:hypothetical protein [Solirubrobacterales bacterium]
MNRKLKVLAVVLCSLACVALPAATAQAASFTASSYPASFAGEGSVGNSQLGTEGGTLQCPERWEGTLSASSESITASWGQMGLCNWFGFQQGEINMNGCDYRFQLTGGSGDSYTAATDIVCPAGQSIVITAGNCIVSFPPQTGLTAADFTVNTAAGDISMQATITGIRYVVTKDGFLCPFKGVGEKTDGTYTHLTPVTLDSAQTLDIG